MLSALCVLCVLCVLVAGLPLTPFRGARTGGFFFRPDGPGGEPRGTAPARGLTGLPPCVTGALSILMLTSFQLIVSPVQRCSGSHVPTLVPDEVGV